MINFIIISSALPTVSYNTHYNVSIIATSTCGQNSTVIEFYYGEFYTVPFLYSEWLDTY